MLLASVAAALAGDGIGLEELPFAELSVAPAGPAEIDESVTVDGPFRLVGVAAGVRSYEAPIPIRPRALFFSSAPDGMRLARGNLKFRFAGDGEDAVLPGTWMFSQHSITVRVKPEATPPRPGEFVLTYPKAHERESSFYRTTAGLPAGAEGDRAFVVRSAQVDDVTREGLYLPAPSRAAWDVAVPAGGVLRLQLGVLPPEMADGTRSDGATLQVKVGDRVVATARARVGTFEELKVPLAEWGGQTVRLALETSDADPKRDHVFVASPQVYVPSEKPRRTVLIFIDTLRRDHLGAYGYQRGASPEIDRFAESSVVFDDTRSVAPWTLPSTRSALSGRQPEDWSTAQTLPMRLAGKGWATAAYVGNVYLSSNFDMSGGWGEHGCVNWPYARVEVDRALDFLDRHDDQDAMVMVHFMDLHLPYKEPWSYRGLYEGERPKGLAEGFTRNALLSAARSGKEKIKNYLVARYDQNLRYVDAEVGRLLRSLPDDAVVVLFADHGEEFFDHGDLEHGHTLYDELLRVPLIVRAPGLAPRRVSGQASLLDLTPTVLDLLGMPDPSLAGHSLAPAARGSEDAFLTGRPIGFGRPLYGNEAWGSLEKGIKYISRSGKELLFDVRSDPGEENNLREENDSDGAREAMAKALGRPTRVGFRVTVKGKSGSAFPVELHVPGGISEFWVGDDPTKHSDATVERVDAETVRAAFTSSRGTHREVFVVPTGDAQTVAPTVTVRVAQEGLAPVTLEGKIFDGFGDVLGRVTGGSRSAEVTYAAIPAPVAGRVIATDDEQNAALCALGYAECEKGTEGGGSEER